MSVSKSYARALFEAAHDAKNTADDLDKMDAQMGELEAIFESSKEARVALLSPVVSAKDKAGAIEKIAAKAGYQAMLSKFLVLLARKNRLSLLTKIRAEFKNVRLEAEGGMLGSLVSADPLSPSDIDGLAKAFTQKLGKKVAFQTSTDSSLLAGTKVTVNGVTYDGTLRAQLNRLRDRLVSGQTISH